MERIFHVARLVPRDMVEVKKERKRMEELLEAQADETSAEGQTD